MNELATTAFYPVDTFHTVPFESARDYFRSLNTEHITHLWTQRNLSTNPKDTQERYVARHLFAQLIDKHCIDDCGPFKFLCDDRRYARPYAQSMISLCRPLRSASRGIVGFRHQPILRSFVGRRPVC
jgi:hypothetical protein